MGWWGGLTENADSADALKGGSQVKNADVIPEQTCSKSVTTMNYVKLSQLSPNVVLKTNFSKKCKQMCTPISSMLQIKPWREPSPDLSNTYISLE